PLPATPRERKKRDGGGSGFKTSGAYRSYFDCSRINKCGIRRVQAVRSYASDLGTETPRYLVRGITGHDRCELLRLCSFQLDSRRNDLHSYRCQEDGSTPRVGSRSCGNYNCLCIADLLRCVI